MTKKWIRWLTVILFVSGSTRGGRLLAQGFDPAAAPSKFTADHGLRVHLFAHEPEIRQAIATKCDDRGRLWTIQYLQYPNPAGLERVEVDRWSRTTYDRIPEPPPKGPPGADRITILEDTDGDGKADRFHDFLSGLNLVTGFEFGHGGVYVLNVPYLLFYPDENRDDVPDEDPRVLLTGFGMEDAQSFANHLTWGPDGWLYGVNGSTTTCKIRGIEFQQGAWRYHPLRDEFELFCEGGSNCFGATFDENGNLFYSTNGGPFVHAIQGGYFYKSFGKHGPLHNRFAYHHFQTLDCDQTPGGPPTGGTIYLGQGLPDKFRGTFMAGNFLGHTASWWHVEPLGSTVRARLGGTLFDAHDTWCGPTDLCTGPDGAVYISDFFDQRTAHPDPDAQWDTRNGRIYRIDQPGPISTTFTDLRERSTVELASLQSQPNGWLSDRARVELAHRRDPTVLPKLDALAQQTMDPHAALRGLWSRYVIDELPDGLALRLLNSPDEAMRAWVVRLAADDHVISDSMTARLTDLARSETSLVVRAQLAASARRLPANMAIAFVWALFQQHDGLPDERVEWSLWWAVEAHAMQAVPQLKSRFATRDAWSLPIAGRIGTLLVRRYAAAGDAQGYTACAALLRTAPRDKQRDCLVALRDGLAERGTTSTEWGQGGLFEDQAVVEVVDDSPTTPTSHAPVEGMLRDVVQDYFFHNATDSLGLEIALLCDLPSASKMLSQRLTNLLVEGEESRVLETLGLWQRFGSAADIADVLAYVDPSRSVRVQEMAVQALGRFSTSPIVDHFLQSYPLAPASVQAVMRDVLFGRVESAQAFLEWMPKQGVKPDQVPLSQIRRLALLNNDAINDVVRSVWGNVGPGSPEEKLATMRRYNNDLRAGTGDPARGKEIFTRQCGKCHKLFNEGGAVGPDLTGTTRQDLPALLANIVDPSAVVRREYLNFIVQTTSGRILTGLLAEQNAASVILLDAEAKRVEIPRDEIEEMSESTTSIMPDRLLDPLSPQEIRDLFSFLQKQ